MYGPVGRRLQAPFPPACNSLPATPIHISLLILFCKKKYFKTKAFRIADSLSERSWFSAALVAGGLVGAEV